MNRVGPAVRYGLLRLHIQAAYFLLTVEFMHLRDQIMHGILPAMSRTEAPHLKQKRQRPCPEAAV